MNKGPRKTDRLLEGGPAPHPLPTHVAIIPDGNGRWARRRGWPRLEGHRAGTENVRRVVRSFADFGVRYLTLFAFSTENWERPWSEVQGLMDILGEVIEREARELHKEGVRVRHLGRLDRLSQGLQEAIRRSVELTRHNTRLTLNIALDYGGKAEVLQAVRRILADGLDPEEVTEEVFSRYLYTAGLPDPDMIIRTAGEMRISNFLLWQGAYSEYYSTPVLWPDFDEAEVRKALEAYSRRQRRFGRVVEEAPPTEDGGVEAGAPADTRRR